MPQVNRAVAMPLTHGQLGLQERVKLGKQLRSDAYDQAFVLPNSWKSALIPFFADIPLRTGYIGEYRWGLLNDARKLNKQLLTMTVQRFVALALPNSTLLPPPYPTPQLSINPAQQQAVIAKFNINLGEKILALCPGAEYGDAKRWPSGYFADLARAKINTGWQIWLFGSEKDKVISGQINQAAKGVCQDFSGRTSLAEAVDLLSLTHTVVSNDSGLMHIAAALDKSVIALYGSSDPNFTPPLNTQARIISLNLACSPCFKRVCPLYPVGHESHTYCLTGIKPESVLELLPP